MRTQPGILSPSDASEESLLVLGEGQCCFIEVQGTEQTLCQSWEKLTGKRNPHSQVRTRLHYRTARPHGMGTCAERWGPARPLTGGQSPFYIFNSTKCPLQWIPSPKPLC